jgi:hypothetical protein
MKPANRIFLLIIFFLICIPAALINFNHDSLWNDEAYTALLMRCSFPELLSNLKSDAHPLLYFAALKVFTLFFGNSVFVMRLFSFAGLLALASLGFGPMKRLLGSGNGILFSFLCLYMPVSVSFAQEARMYTWTCFLITGMIMYGYLSIESKKKKDLLLYAIFSIGAIYTHIYGLLVFIIWCCIASAWQIFRKRTSLKPFLHCSVIVLLSYLPWLHVTLFQVNHAAQNPWFVKTSIPQIAATLFILFTDRFLIVNFIPGFAAIVVLSYYLFFRGVHRAFAKPPELFPILLSGVLLSTFLSAIIISILIAPILMPRYAFTVFGIFLIVVIYGVNCIDNVRVRAILGIIILLLFIPERIHVHANRINGPLPEIQTWLNNRVDSSQVFLHSNEHTFTTFAWYFPQNNHYLYEPGSKDALRKFTGNGFRVNDLKSIVKNRQAVWVVNKLETHINKYVSGTPLTIQDPGDSSGFVKTLESDTFKVLPVWYPGRTYLNFEMTPYWFQVRISRFEKKN